MSWTKVALYFGIAGPVALIAQSVIGLFLPDVLESAVNSVLFALTLTAGLGALVTGIGAFSKEGKSQKALFAVIIGSLWVLFGLFIVLFVPLS